MIDEYSSKHNYKVQIDFLYFKDLYQKRSDCSKNYILVLFEFTLVFWP